MLDGNNNYNNNKIKRVLDENNNIVYSGEISYYDINNVYVIEIEKIDGTKGIYLTEKILQFKNLYNYNILGSNIMITDNQSYNSDYGKVISITPFYQYISVYSDIKEIYTAEEVTAIFENIEKDYSELSKNKDIKKLELKK